MVSLLFPEFMISLSNMKQKELSCLQKYSQHYSMIPPKIFPFQLRETVSMLDVQNIRVRTVFSVFFFYCSCYITPRNMGTWISSVTFSWSFILRKTKMGLVHICHHTEEISGGNNWRIMTHLFSPTPVYKPHRSHHCYQPFTEGTWQPQTSSAAHTPSLVNHSGFSQSPLIWPLSLLYLKTMLALCTGAPKKAIVLQATVQSWSLLENSSFLLA